MNKRFLAGFGFAAFLVMTAFSVAALSRSKERPAPIPEAAQAGESLPAVLEALYPPKAQGPVLLVKMIGLAESFGGMLGDLFENDLPNVSAGFEKFKAQYADVAALVPEWKGLYPMAPVDELGAALKSGDQGRVMAAVEKVGAVCTACHVENMARVHFRYGWPEFSAVKAKDPLTGEDVSFSRLMLLLDVSFSGIGADLEQGQAEEARKQFQGFQARFEAADLLPRHGGGVGESGVRGFHRKSPPTRPGYRDGELPQMSPGPYPGGLRSNEAEEVDHQADQERHGLRRQGPPLHLPQ